MQKEDSYNTMSLKMNEKGARVPYWLLAAAVGVIVLAAESRIRLSTAAADIQTLKAKISKVDVIEHQTQSLEREQEASKMRDEKFSQRLGHVQTTLTVICTKLGANCPKD